MRKLLPGSVLTAVSLLAIVAANGHRTAAATHHPLVAGLWLGTVYYGDPASPATPTERFTATLHRDGTYMVNSTAATGVHPVNPGAKTPEQGLWRLQGRNLAGRGFWFDEGGGGGGFSVGRSVTQLELVAPDRASGFYDVSFAPCSGGPAFCPDPATLSPMMLGEGLGPFPVIMTKVH